MIEFDANQIRYDIVYLRRINRRTLEIVSDDKGQPYHPEGVTHRTNAKGHTMIDIHQKVSQLYLQRNQMAEFSGEGQRAYLFYYGNRVIVMDVYRYSTSAGVNQKDWVSLCVAAFDRVSTVIKKDSLFEDKKAKMYFDGEHLFYLSPHKETPMGHPNFSVRAVRAIHLGRMAVRSYTTKMERELEGKKDADPNKEKEDKTLIVIKDGVVMIYRPFGENDPRMVISPVYTGKSDKDMRRIRKETGHLFAHDVFIKELADYGINHDKMRFTLGFALRAGKTIGRHYGYLETEFLNIPKIVLDTGVINLTTDIDLRSRERYPLDIPFFDGFAYLMRFFYMEKDMDRFRDLTALFTFTMTKGMRKLDSKNQEDHSVFRPEYEEIGVPALNVKEFKDNWKPGKNAQMMAMRLHRCLND